MSDTGSEYEPGWSLNLELKLETPELNVLLYLLQASSERSRC